MDAVFVFSSISQILYSVTVPIAMVSKYVESQRGKEKFIDDENYIYDVHMYSADKIRLFWLCEMRKTACKARIHKKIQDGENVIVKKINNYNNSCTSAKVKARSAISEIKCKIQNGESSSIRMILADTVNKLDENVKSEISSLPTISRSITNNIINHCLLNLIFSLITR